MKVEYADRELAPNGGFMPEDFAEYLESICKRHEAEGYYLTAVLPGPTSDGEVRGAWLFFSDRPYQDRLDVSTAAETIERPEFP